VYLRWAKKALKLAAKIPYAATWSVHSATDVEKAFMPMQGNELFRNNTLVDPCTHYATQILAHDVGKKCTTPVSRVAINLNHHRGYAQIIQASLC
jgi:hypothetical protein